MFQKGGEGMERADFTSKSIMLEENGAYRFAFFCELCDQGYATHPIGAKTVKEAFDCAQKEARQYFNRCRRCHAWVCDEHYNEDFMMCTNCAPREKEKEA